MKFLFALLLLVTLAVSSFAEDRAVLAISKKWEWYLFFYLLLKMLCEVKTHYTPFRIKSQYIVVDMDLVVQYEVFNVGTEYALGG